MYTEHNSHGRKEIYRGRNRAGRHPNIVEDKTGVWTKSEQTAEGIRRRTQEREAAQKAEAEIRAEIEAINAAEMLTPQQKVGRLNMLTASGYSTEEFLLINLAREQAREEL